MTAVTRCPVDIALTMISLEPGEIKTVTEPNTVTAPKVAPRVYLRR